MAIRACNNPQITGPVLSHKIIKLVAVRATAVVACIIQKRKADTTGLRVALSTGKGKGGINESVATLSWQHHEHTTPLRV